MFAWIYCYRTLEKITAWPLIVTVFTSLKLAEELMTKKTTILGTIRKQQREVPNTESLMKYKLSHVSEIFSFPSNCSLTVHKAKKKKIVCILSSTHKHVKVDESHKKKLPETVQYYKKSKVGVDVLNQMARYHTCKSSSRRWPVAVFFNILDWTIGIKLAKLCKSLLRQTHIWKSDIRDMQKL